MSMTLSTMRHLFREEAVGEVVEIIAEDGSLEKRQARIEAYDPSSETFSIVYFSASQEDDRRCLIDNICLNDLFSRGYLTFKELMFRCLGRHPSAASTYCDALEASAINARSKQSISPRTRLRWPAGTLQANSGVDPLMQSIRRKRVSWPAAVLMPACGEPRMKRLRAKRACATPIYRQTKLEESRFLDCVANAHTWINLD